MRPVQAKLLHDRIERFDREILAFLRRRVPSYAEELTQETWLRVAKADPECADDGAFRAYAYTVARRLIVDFHRRRSARIRLVSIERPDHDTPLDPVDPAASADGPAEASRLLDAIERELAKMKPEIAQVFRWRMTEDVSFKEIAERQGVPLNTALGRHHRATKALAKALAEQGLMPRESGS